MRLSRKGNGVYKVVPVGGEGKNSGDQMSLFYACLQWESNPSGQVLLLYDAGLDERAARDCEELARGAGVRFVRSPEELAGLSATVTGEKLLIQYDGPVLAAGVGDTVSPANCIPYLLRALAEGYVLEVGEETLEDTPCRRLTLDTTDADGEKVVCTVWLAEEDPVYAELSREGKLLLSVRFTAFQQTESDGGE